MELNDQTRKAYERIALELFGIEGIEAELLVEAVQKEMKRTLAANISVYTRFDIEMAHAWNTCLSCI